MFGRIRGSTLGAVENNISEGKNDQILGRYCPKPRSLHFTEQSMEIKDGF